MKIGPTNNPNIILDKQQRKVTKEPLHQHLNDVKKDSVEISKSGREKLKNLADSYKNEIGNDNDVIEQIAPKLARIRNKIEAGYYDLEDVTSKIIDKLTDSISIDNDNTNLME